ncbi:MAG: hypothetical protein IT318_03925 [Anaerolineales bacterium]|nr:hypothetical protein [Anaerolineales bacterium]
MRHKALVYAMRDTTGQHQGLAFEHRDRPDVGAPLPDQGENNSLAAA